jgi:hypothetical protein
MVDSSIDTTSLAEQSRIVVSLNKIGSIKINKMYALLEQSNEFKSAEEIAKNWI